MTIMVLKKCPNCLRQMDIELLLSYNKQLEDYNPNSKKLKCPSCELASHKGLWERIKI